MEYSLGFSSSFVVVTENVLNKTSTQPKKGTKRRLTYNWEFDNKQSCIARMRLV